jgi:hypothetical protein
MICSNSKAPRRRIRFHRPLVSVWTALTLIGGDRPEEIIALIEEGQLRFAFDIRTKKAQVREIRILGQSINEFLAGDPAPAISEQDDFNLAMQAVFPAAMPAIPAFEIARAWNASRDHVLNLCRGRELSLVKGARIRRGRGGSPMVEMRSATEFLRQRRVF